MRIFVVSPFGACEPNGAENLQKVARPDTAFTFESLNEVFPLPYNTFRYNVLKCTDGAVERIIRAEQDGYDAAVVSCMLDPGLYEARGVVDIPVTGAFEASGLISMTMGEQYSVITMGPEANLTSAMRRLANSYGFSSRIASIRHIELRADKLYPEETPTDQVLDMLERVGKQCVEEDGAEVIVPGCTILGALFTHGFKRDPVEVFGVPILDPMVAAFKMAELMVDLRQLAGYPAVSQRGQWKKQPADEFAFLREWLSSHPPAVNHYQAVAAHRS